MLMFGGTESFTMKKVAADRQVREEKHSSCTRTHSLGVANADAVMTRAWHAKCVTRRHRQKDSSSSLIC